MYICSCHAVTDGRIRKAAQTGEAKTWKELTRLTGCGTQCGTCARDAKAIFDRAVEEMRKSGSCQAQTEGSACCQNCPLASALKPGPEPEV
jgi:bacterioferritin-associated ferredoxin